MPITLPQININGTARSDLLENYMAARLAVQRAIDAMHATSPHGRDYLPQGSPEANARLYAALGEHADRVMRLRSVLMELDALAEHVV